MSFVSLTPPPGLEGFMPVDLCRSLNKYDGLKAKGAGFVGYNCNPSSRKKDILELANGTACHVNFRTDFVNLSGQIFSRVIILVEGGNFGLYVKPDTIDPSNTTDPALLTETGHQQYPPGIRTIQPNRFRPIIFQVKSDNYLCDTSLANNSPDLETNLATLELSVPLPKPTKTPELSKTLFATSIDCQIPTQLNTNGLAFKLAGACNHIQFDDSLCSIAFRPHRKIIFNRIFVR